MDKLDSIFAMQRDLNTHIGIKHGLEVLIHPEDATEVDKIAWLLKFNKALAKESNELDDCYVWKWWADDYGDFDWQNARVELVDILHFFVSMCICADMTPDELFRIYNEKWLINRERQERGYVVANKTEDDNRTIR